MNRRLIVNSDDYGRTSKVSEGIRAAHLNGIVTSTTCMMNFPNVEEDLLCALKECPELGLGVHLVLTSGEPVLDPSEVPSLVTDSGRFWNLSELLEKLDQLDLNEVRREWGAQLNKFRAITRRSPTHLDSHHHSSFFTPALFKMMLEYARENNCAIRKPYVNFPAGSPSGLPADVTEPALHEFLSLVDEYKPRNPDYFIAAFYDEQANFEVLKSVLHDLPEGSSELMCHPGYSDDLLAGGSIYNIQREAELKVLTDPSVRSIITEREIELITFANL
jgi:chitin disaccharide deacetylase